MSCTFMSRISTDKFGISAGGRMEVDGEPASSGEPASDIAALTSLVEAGGVISPAIKAVLDREMVGSYEGVIRTHIRQKDVLIARLCSAHYQEFIGSIDSLVTLKADIRSLDEQIRQVNSDVHGSGCELVEVANKLLEWRRASLAMKKAKFVLNICIRALESIAKAQAASNQGQLMSALKLVGNAERALQGTLPGSSPISAVILARMIPSTVGRIKQRVCTDADSWMLQAQSKAPQIGAWAILNTEKRIRQEMAKESNRYRERMRQLYFQGDEAERDATTLSSAVNDVVDIESGAPDEDLFERIAFEFNSIYQALHIYESLDIPREFSQYYTDNRTAQISKMLEYTPPSTPTQFLESIAPFFARITGFFIIEDSVVKSGNALMAKSTMTFLWDSAISSIKVVLNDDLIGLMSGSEILDLKHQIVLFCHTLSQFGLASAPLISYIASHRDKYEEVLVVAFKTDLDEIFADEKYEPMTIKSAEEYRKSVLTFGLEPSDLKENIVEFPLSVSFSATVPKVGKLMKHFIADYFAFASSLPEMLGHIRQCVDELLLNVINAKLNSILDGDTGNLNVSQAVQIAVNADALLTLCIYWERLITVYHDPKPNAQSLSLNAKVAFSDTRTRGEDSIFEVIDRKITDMLDLLAGSIDWCPQIVQTGPCDTVQMMVSFLETIMNCTQYMPASFANEAEKINVLAMYNLEQDVRHLETYAAKTAIPNLHEAFAQIRQVIGLFLMPQPEKLLEENVRQTRFPLISAHKMASLLDKFKETPFLSLVPPELPKHSKKVIENVAKKLRSMSY